MKMEINPKEKKEKKKKSNRKKAEKKREIKKGAGIRAWPLSCANEHKGRSLKRAELMNHSENMLGKRRKSSNNDVA